MGGVPGFHTTNIGVPPDSNCHWRVAFSGEVMIPRAA